MDGDIIEIRVYDNSYTKIFQFSAKLNNKKALEEFKNILQQKGVMNKKEMKDIDFF